MTTTYARSGFTEEERDKIAASIRNFVAVKGISRKTLERPDLSASTINKALTGEFSDATLAKIESILGHSFSKKEEAGSPKHLGGYSRDTAVALEGEYICLRPTFDRPGVFTRYKIDINWNQEKKCLCFFESQRFDAKYVQNGEVCIPFGKPFFNLLTIVSGSVRLITLSIPEEDGIARGILVTLNNPRGVHFVPVSAPVALKRMDADASSGFGLVAPGSEFYDETRTLLESVASENFGNFITDMRAEP